MKLKLKKASQLQPMKDFVPYVLFLFLSLQLSAQDVFEAARKGDVAAMEALCDGTPELLNTANSEGYTPLMLSAYHGHEAMAAYLVEIGAKVDGVSKYGTPLMAAAVKGNNEIVDLLLSHGADPDFADANGTTALLYTAIFGFNEVSESLLKAGANAKLKDKKGNMALDYAILRQNEKLIKLLNQYQ